jgi:hypothetical protein
VGGAGVSTFNLNGGTFNFTGNSITLDNFNIGVGHGGGANGSFTLGSGQTLKAGNETIGELGIGAFTQNGGTHTVGGTLVIGESGEGAYTLNAGSLEAGSERIGRGHDTGGTGTFNQSGGAHTVSGYYRVGGTYNQSGGTNTARGTLTLGIEHAYYGGTYNLSGSGSLWAQNEDITTDSHFTQSGGTNTVAGTLRVGPIGSYNLSSGSLSAGNETIDIGNPLGSYWGIYPGTFTQSGGTHTVAGTMTLATDAGGNSGIYNLTGGTLKANTIVAPTDVSYGMRAFNFTGGTLSVGQFTGNLFNNGGTLAPGNSPGVTNITGNYTQSALGAYAVQIAGLSAGQYDVLNVTGTATLDGLLSVSLLDIGGIMPPLHAGDYFDILTAEALYGAFSSLSFAALSNPYLYWHIDYLHDINGSTTDVVRLTYVSPNPPPPVPEPETYAMLLAGLGLLGFTARRKKRDD